MLFRSKDFRSSIGGEYASIVSAIPEVRQALLQMQQDFAKNPTFADGSSAKGAVYDGRDTGTVVCPNANIKFFITYYTTILNHLFRNKALNSVYMVRTFFV